RRRPRIDRVRPGDAGPLQWSGLPAQQPGLRAGEAMTAALLVEFCGEEFSVQPGETFTVGRDADLVIDEDNAYLHRRMIEFSYVSDFWWIANVGSRIAVTVSGEAGTLQSWLGPGSRIPVVLPEASILFTAGGTTYEIEVRAEVSVFSSVPAEDEGMGEYTLGAVPLTPS